MKHFLRFDSVGGASGDMILSALAALGADMQAIEQTIGAFMHILPFLEQGPLYDINSKPLTVGANTAMPFGPPRDFFWYTPWTLDVPVYCCPSAPKGLF